MLNIINHLFKYVFIKMSEVDIRLNLIRLMDGGMVVYKFVHNFQIGYFWYLTLIFMMQPKSVLEIDFKNGLKLSKKSSNIKIKHFFNNF